MKTLIITIFLMSGICSAQFITFPSYPKGIDTQFGGFVDPIGKPPMGGNGRQKGVNFTLLMNGGFIELAVSNFEQLKNGYTDFVVSGGVNFYLFRNENIRYFVGPRLSGWVYRDVRHELAGGVIGADFRVTNENRNAVLYLGWMVFADYSTDLKDGNGYRSSNDPNKNLIFNNSQIRENGAIRMSIRFN
jgi:hypothetical protein